MKGEFGAYLDEYAARVRALRAVSGDLPDVARHIFGTFEDWERLLLFKLAPRLAGEGCLIVAVVGGTNTGKSTVFNTLLQSELSPVSPFGAYTRHPLAAAGGDRYGQCLERGKLLPEAFIPRPVAGASPSPGESHAVADAGQESMALFVARHDALPESLVVLDTPDIDSVIRHNWELAKSIREAGDVMVAVLTGQKYADSLVVEFFREALRSGRRLIPLMNFADDGDAGYAVTRQQLQEFLSYLTAGLEGDSGNVGPAFVMDRMRPGEWGRAVALDDPGMTLWSHLMSLDAVGLKQQILRDSVERFCEGAGAFCDNLGRVAAQLAEGLAEFTGVTRGAVADYVPKPGREVVTVVYDYIQENANMPDRVLGAVTAQAVKVPRLAVTTTRRLLRRRPVPPVTEQDLNAEQRREVGEIAARLYSRLMTQSVGRLRERAPFAAERVEQSLRDLEPVAVSERVVAQVMRTDDYLAAYRAYAYQELDRRWRDRTFRWTVKTFYRLGLLGSWAGVLVLLWSHGWAPGLPISEILASLGVPLFQHTVTHGALYLWGDKLAGLIRKWQELQRDVLEQALHDHLIVPAIGPLRALQEQLTEHHRALEELNTKCRKM